MILSDNILTPIGNLRGSLSSGGLIPGVPIIYGEASGNIATFSIAADQPLKKIQIDLDATGWSEAKISKCGLNIWDEQTINKYISNTGDEYTQNKSLCSKNLCKCNPSTKYYVVSKNDIQILICWYDINGNFISRSNNYINNTEITSPANAYYFKLSMGTYVDSGTAVYNHDISVNSNFNITTYEEYKIETYTINWQDLGTISNGKLIIEDGIVKVISGGIEHILGTQIINTYEGDNNIWSDTGQIDQCIFIVDAGALLQWIYDNLYP